MLLFSRNQRIFCNLIRSRQQAYPSLLRSILSTGAGHSSTSQHAGTDAIAKSASDPQPSTHDSNIPVDIHLEEKKETFGEWMFEPGWRRPLKVEEGWQKQADWMSFGYVWNDEYYDWAWHHTVMFFGYCVFMYGFGSALFYGRDWPDMHEWARRESYLELARREKYGYPYISPDYIERSKLEAQLPSEEELGEYPIII